MSICVHESWASKRLAFTKAKTPTFQQNNDNAITNTWLTVLPLSSFLVFVYLISHVAPMQNLPILSLALKHNKLLLNSTICFSSPVNVFLLMSYIKNWIVLSPHILFQLFIIILMWQVISSCQLFTYKLIIFSISLAFCHITVVTKKLRDNTMFYAFDPSS